VILGLAIVLIGLFGHFWSTLGLGPLSGNIVIERDHFTLYLPLAICLIASLPLIALLWAMNR
jgi:hypothetical protein